MRSRRCPERRSGRGATLLLLVIGAGAALIVCGAMLASTAAGVTAVRTASVRATVNEDGSLTVTDRLVVRLSSLSTDEQLTLELDHLRGSDLKILTVIGPSGRLERTDVAPQAGEYKVASDDHGMRIQTRVPRQTVEDAVYVVRYVVTGAVRRDDDEAVLLWPFVSDRWPVPTERLAVNVVLPSDADPHEIEAWGRVPPGARILVVETGGVLVTAMNVPRATGTSLLVVFPSAAVPGLAATDAVDVDDLTADWPVGPATLASPTEAPAPPAQGAAAIEEPFVLLFGLVVPLVAVAAYVVMVFTVGRGYRIDLSRRQSADIPADLPPAAVAVLWDQRTVTTRGFAATVLDLVRRGSLTVAAAGAENPLSTAVTGLRAGPEAAPPPETSAGVAQELLLQAVDHDGLVTSEGLRAHLTHDPSRAREQLARFLAAAMSDGGREIRERTHPAAMVTVTALGIATILAGTVATARSGWPWLLLSPAAGVLMLVFSGHAVMRPPETAVRLYRDYGALRRYLAEAGRFGGTPPSAVVLWERYLVLAVALGLGDRIEAAYSAGGIAPKFAAAPPILTALGSERRALETVFESIERE